MIGAARDMRWTILVSVLLGVFLSPLSGLSPLASLYDTVWPVVVMQGEVVARDSDSVTIHMWGSKNRDCEFKGLQGFGRVEESGLSRDAAGYRTDMKSTGATKPKGAFDIGYWRFKPVAPDTKIVEVWVQHKCGDRTVVTRIAKVNL